MKLTTALSPMFNGDCEAAFRFYERCLNGTIAFMLTWGDSPAAADVPPGWESGPAGSVPWWISSAYDGRSTANDQPSRQHSNPVR